LLTALMTILKKGVFTVVGTLDISLFRCMELSAGLTQQLATVANNPVPANTSVGSADFPVELQQLSNWCWAASALALSNFYGPGGQFTQQQIVAGVLNMPICGIGPPNPVCNLLADFTKVLTFVSHFNSEQPPLDQSTLIAQLSTNNPVGCQMNIPGIGGHIVLIVAAMTDANDQLFVTVADPSDGTLPVMTFTQFCDNFRDHGGQWATAYLTS
jgi:hypothetical protein